ncbi:hypothetical protein [Flagellimonas allohymeniacidonis]|uniref:Lipoprotein n=1 Tax=Flagellimonas allohymeniacidonis TaxID=2517819 RepID=A0A4V2HSD3_9FLAO|nr:hypothetical protein [Allomuricauda hymeniacidonis]TAI47330.1 hypothetical protein EW142_11665 [Allomuricauda hymeniacidonis]
MRVLLSCFAILFSLSATCQKQIKNDKTNDVFNGSERDSLQLWFYDRSTVMGLNEDKRNEFYNTVLYHTYKMKALEKKEKGYTSDQIRQKFNELLLKQHKEVKTILDEKQYAYYLDTYDKLLRDIYDRKGWK